MSAAASSIPSAEDRAARQVAMLRELADLGMELARALGAQALAELSPPDETQDAPRPAPRNPVLMFTRVARAVRQTLALEARLADPTQDAETRRWRAEAEHARQARKAQVRAVARTIVETDGAACNRDRMLNSLDARLEAEGEDDEDFAWLPLGVLVARVCRELGVRPDWSLWAETDWAKEEARAQVPGSPFAGPGAPRPDPAALRPPRPTRHSRRHDRRALAP